MTRDFDVFSVLLPPFLEMCFELIETHFLSFFFFYSSTWQISGQFKNFYWQNLNTISAHFAFEMSSCPQIVSACQVSTYGASELEEERCAKDW